MVLQHRSNRRRLYRRRRLAVALVLAAGLGLVTAQAVRADAPTPPGAVVVVRPGQTLWGLGAEYAPQVDRRRWVYEVARLNHLSGMLQAGQALVLPG